MTSVLRPMLFADLPSVIALERANQIAPWSDTILQDCLKLHYDAWVIEVNNVIVGFIIGLIRAGECHVLNVCVNEMMRRHGLGQQLMQKLLLVAREKNVEMAFLEVRFSNEPAIKLYRKLGFNEIGVRKDYYPAQNGREDALVFALQLL